MLSCLSILFFFTLLVLPVSTQAWSSVGHKIVAHIAYDHLTPEAKKAVDRLTLQDVKTYSGRNRFVFASTWADWSRDHGDTRFRRWHYIDLPLSSAGQKTQAPNAMNAVYGINHCQVVLKKTKASFAEKSTCLKLLVHIVGDIHQPLHCVNRFSPLHPKGDRGGGGYLIKSPVAANLHAYWDRGLGQFASFQRRTSISNKKLQLYAQTIEKKYPIATYHHLGGAMPLLRREGRGADSRALDSVSAFPIEWAREGRVLSESVVYQLVENGVPSSSYINQGIGIVEKQLALAGYRLAAILNTLYTQ